MSVGSFVLDTSVTLGALFKDEQDDYSLAVLGTLDDAVAVVPSLWHLELGNILGRAIKAKRMTAADLDESWERLGALGIKTVPILDDARFWAERALECSLGLVAPVQCQQRHAGVVQRARGRLQRCGLLERGKGVLVTAFVVGADALVERLARASRRVHRRHRPASDARAAPGRNLASAPPP